MAENKKEEEKEGQEAEVKPKSKKKLIIIIAVVLIVLGAGVPVFLMGGGEEKKAEHVEEEEKEKKYELLKLDTFIVNLSENTTFLKVTMLLEYDPEVLNALNAHAEGEGHAGGEGYSGGGGEKAEGAAGAGHPHFDLRKPMMQDAIIKVLSSKKSTDVLTNEGKEQLKQELIETINEALGLEEAAVVNIYFTEFIIQ